MSCIHSVEAGCNQTNTCICLMTLDILEDFRNGCNIFLLLMSKVMCLIKHYSILPHSSALEVGQIRHMHSQLAFHPRILLIKLCFLLFSALLCKNLLKQFLNNACSGLFMLDATRFFELQCCSSATRGHRCPLTKSLCVGECMSHLITSPFKYKLKLMRVDRHIMH